MKAIVIAFALTPILIAGDASAISRRDVSDMSCAQTQALVRSEGAVILRFRSPAIQVRRSMTAMFRMTDTAAPASKRRERAHPPPTLHTVRLGGASRSSFLIGRFRALLLKRPPPSVWKTNRNLTRGRRDRAGVGQGE